MRRARANLQKFPLVILAGLLNVGAIAQTSSPPVSPASARRDIPSMTGVRFEVSSLPPGTFGEDAGQPTQRESSDHDGVVTGSLKRVFEDQKELYKAPFKPSNLGWSALVVGGTAVLLVEDRNIESALPIGHATLYSGLSNAGIAAMGGALAGLWAYGVKTDHPHARETGELALETLVNTFLVYAPMQFIAARQRPGEGNGRGDFWKHSGLNTSFPSGHAMFTWSMAAVAAHEYPKPWVEALSYSVAAAVTASRLLGHDHWPSDLWVGSALGFGIGTHIFHARCQEGLSEACKHRVNKVEYRTDQKQDTVWDQR